jgi:WD40 repeat protein
MSIDDTSKYLVSGDSTGCVYVWEASTGKIINKLLMPKVPSIRSVNFSYLNDLISIAYGGRTATSESVVDIYKFEDLLKKEKKVEPLKTILIPDNDKIAKTRWCDLGKVIVVASEKGMLYKYDYETKNLLLKKQIHDKQIMDIDISPKEELIMTAAKDGKAKILDPDTFDVMSELFPQSPVRNINACRFSPLISEEDEKKVKYHAFIAGGQESRDVTTTTSKKGGNKSYSHNLLIRALFQLPEKCFLKGFIAGGFAREYFKCCYSLIYEHVCTCYRHGPIAFCFF